MVNLNDLLEKKNKDFQQAQKKGEMPHEKEFTRKFLISLPSTGLTYKEIKFALCLALADKVRNPSAMPWEKLRKAIYEQYMLDIGDEKKPLVRPVWGCWLNVPAGEISTVKPYNPFVEKDECIWITDIRIIGEIDWKDIVIS